MYRSTILDTFSTFIQFEQEHFQRWIAQRSLVQSMRRGLASEDSQGNDISRKHAWAFHWHAIWKANHERIPWEHLLAYLQDPCYYIAKEFAQFSDSTLSLTDYFQVLMSQAPKVVGNFRRDRGASIATFAKTALHHELSNYLRRIGERDQSSAWSLLRYQSNKVFCNALTACGGLTQSELEQYRLARMYFNEYYAAKPGKGQRQLPAPDEETWHKITDAYNRERSPSAPKATIETMKLWLEENAVIWMREYMYPSALSFNKSLTDEGGGEFQDVWLPSDADLSAYEALFQLETQDNQQEMSVVLEEAIVNLPEFQQEYLHAHYQEKKTQTQIARDYGIRQDKVCRALQSVKKQLLIVLINWAKTQGSENVPEVSKGLSELLEVWLRESWGNAA